MFVYSPAKVYTLGIVKNDWCVSDGITRKKLQYTGLEKKESR